MGRTRGRESSTDSTMGAGIFLAAALGKNGCSVGNSPRRTQTALWISPRRTQTAVGGSRRNTQVAAGKTSEGARRSGLTTDRLDGRQEDTTEGQLTGGYDERTASPVDAHGGQSRYVGDQSTISSVFTLRTISFVLLSSRCRAALDEVPPHGGPAERFVEFMEGDARRGVSSRC